MPSDREQARTTEAEALGTKGTCGTRQQTNVPNFNNVERENFISNDNSWIVLGGDRTSSPFSGYSAMGDKQSSAIDLVVGRGAGTKEDLFPDKDVTVNSNTLTDAARIYITQKGDADTDFGIASGVYGEFMNSDKKSAVVAKADHIRLMGREGIKIVTGKAKNAFGQSEKNSIGGEVGKVPPIQLIAGNYTDDNFILQSNRILQPLAKGENLVEYLTELQKWLRTLLSRVQTNTVDLMGCNATLAVLTSPVPAISAVHVGYITSETIRSGMMILDQMNLATLQVNYLDSVGKTYINSAHVFTT